MSRIMTAAAGPDQRDDSDAAGRPSDRNGNSSLEEPVRPISIQDLRSQFETSVSSSSSASASASSTSSTTKTTTPVAGAAISSKQKQRPTMMSQRSKSVGDTATLCTTASYTKSKVTTPSSALGPKMNAKVEMSPAAVRKNRNVSSTITTSTQSPSTITTLYNVQLKKVEQEQMGQSTAATTTSSRDMKITAKNPSPSSAKSSIPSWDSQPLTPVMHSNSTSSTTTTPSLTTNRSIPTSTKSLTSLTSSTPTNIAPSNHGEEGCVKPSDIVKKSKASKTEKDKKPKVDFPRSVSLGNVKSLTFMYDIVEKAAVENNRHPSSGSVINNEMKSTAKSATPRKGRVDQQKDVVEQLKPLYDVASLKKVNDVANKGTRFNHSQTKPSGVALFVTVDNQWNALPSPSEPKQKKQWPISSKYEQSLVNNPSNLKRSTSLPASRDFDEDKRSTSATSHAKFSNSSPSIRHDGQKLFGTQESKKQQGQIIPSAIVSPQKYEHGSSTRDWNWKSPKNPTRSNSKSDEAQSLGSNDCPQDLKQSTSKELEALRAMALTKAWNSTTALPKDSSLDKSHPSNKSSKELRRRNFQVQLSSKSPSSSSISSSNNRRNSFSISKHSSAGMGKSASKIVAQSPRAKSDGHKPFKLEEIRSSLKKVSSGTRPEEKKVVHRWNPVNIGSDQKVSSRQNELDEIRALRLAKKDHYQAGEQSQMELLVSGGERVNSHYANTFVTPRGQSSGIESATFTQSSHLTGGLTAPPQKDSLDLTCDPSCPVASSENKIESLSVSDDDCAKSLASVSISGRGQSLQSPSNHIVRSLDEADGLVQSGSEYSTSTEAGYYSYAGADDYYGNDDDNQYIQISLSSGGIATKFVPNIAMSTTEDSEVLESRDDEDDCQSSRPVPSTMFPENFESQNDRRKSRELIKGAAKRFFFGKKSTAHSAL